jgi:phage terminase large subunit GpA-like protein
MMDAVHERRRPKIVFMTCTQVVKSEALNNIAAYFIDQEPRPILLVQPTDTMAKGYSKRRIAPMLLDCDVLRMKVHTALSRQSGNEILLKEFDGGFLRLAGANSAAGLRSDNIAVLLLDEIDGYPDDVDGEGNPIDIAERRIDSYDDAVEVLASTPAKPQGFSRIERAYQASDQRRYFVPCPFCRQMQTLRWRDDPRQGGAYRLVWETGPEGKVLRESLAYLCEGCGARIPEKHKRAMLEAGAWRAQAPENTEAIGFHLNALYYPFRDNWADLAEEWLNAQGDREKLKTFINLRLAETWDEGAESGIEPDALRERAIEVREEQTLPAEVCVLVAAVDVQHNRLEAHTVGFGPGEEAWLLDYQQFYGNPGAPGKEGEPDIWGQLDEFLLKPWKHPSGFDFTPAITLVDSGHHADSVYDFVAPLQAIRRVYACKGVERLSRPGLVEDSSVRKGNIRLLLVGTYPAKDRLFARLEIAKPGPGYLHLPAWIPDDYLGELTAEKKVPLMNKRTRTQRYVYKKVQTNNEALDLMVYAYAGLAALQQFVAPQLYRDLTAVKATLDARRSPQSLIPVRSRRMRTQAIYTPLTP